MLADRVLFQGDMGPCFMNLLLVTINALYPLHFGSPTMRFYVMICQGPLGTLFSFSGFAGNILVLAHVLHVSTYSFRNYVIIGQ